ncbi:hypothetical protein N7462_007375 [Penicillium macrosclerotiorum]|uniref:uncharacterized protein n=1 Tax=Penicillium macrosclerotiorum TaxID=303699 RepID=UPI002549AF18|nr:uncharacterized protein N7462_007375 [Penicillium macrosclerotiorum]KAJ5679131.1 hypothetical protein N7462_007375 [Penicillium macrosclerotiorum]
MKLTSVSLYSAVLGLAHASPVYKRAGITDADILNYALTLEHLEAAFYEEGLKNYTQADFVNAGMKDPFYSNLKMVGMDEQSHEQFLTQALTGKYSLHSYTCLVKQDSIVTDFLYSGWSQTCGEMRVFIPCHGCEQLPCSRKRFRSAYLGAAASIMNDTYLTAAGSILTVEARHSAYLRAVLGEAPAAQAFDNPLDLNEVYTVASPFIVSCPSSNQPLPVKAFPSLTMISSAPTMNGATVQFMTGSSFDTSNTTGIYAAFITVTGPVWTPVTSNGDGKFTVTIPMGIAGQSYVVLTKGNSQATDDNIVAGPAIVECYIYVRNENANNVLGFGLGLHDFSFYNHDRVRYCISHLQRSTWSGFKQPY